MTNLPSSRALRDSLLRVLASEPHGLRTDEIDKLVADDLKLTDQQKSMLRVGNRTELGYRLAWERTKAKKAGLITRSGARTWKKIN